MTNESHVMALLEEGNPATELGDNAWSHLDAAAYLATLQERSSEMTELKTRALEKRRDPGTERRRPRWVPVLVATVLALIVGTGLMLTSGSSDESPVVTQPPPTTTEVPTTTEIPTTATTAVESRLAEVPIWLGRGDPGTYQPMRFEVPFGFTLADGGWETGVDSETMFAICGPDVPGPVGARSACFRASAVAVFLLGHETVADTETYLGTFPGAEISDVESISIDGAEGVRFSYNNDLSPHSNPEGGFDGYPWWLHETQEIPLGADKAIVTIVDVEGIVVTAVYQGRAIAEPTAFDTNLAEGMAIIDSIIWGD